MFTQSGYISPLLLNTSAVFQGEGLAAATGAGAGVDGWAMLLRPTAGPVSDPRQQLNIRLDAELADQLKAMAAAEGVSLNQLVVRVLRAAAEQAPAQATVLQRLDAIEKRLDALGG